MRARAELVARELGLRVAALREVALDAADQVRPMPRAMAMAARADAGPAVSAPEEISVAVTASAELTLTL